MKIVFKYVLKNMWEKKGRTLLVILAIILSSSIFFSTQSLSKNLENMYLNVVRKDFGTADIIVEGNKSPEYSLFDVDVLDNEESRYEAVVRCFAASGYLVNIDETQLVNLYGYNSVSDLEDTNPVLMAMGKQTNEKLDKDDIIISETVANKYNLKIGDIVTIRINNNDETFEVAGLAYSKGMFIDTGSQISAIVSQERMNELFGVENKINCMFIKLTDDQIISEEIKRINEIMPNQNVSEIFSENASKAYTDRITVSFNLMSIAVFFISIFLIYSSFKVISLERMPIFGVFRSIGATKLSTNVVLIIEAVTCAAIGGLIGCIGGIGLLYLMLYYSAPAWMHTAGIPIEMEFSYITLAFSFLFSILIALISVIIPAISTNKYSISTLIKSKKDDEKTIKLNPVVCGIKVVLFVGFMLGVLLIPENWMVFYGTVTCVAVIVLMLLLVYDIIRILCFLLKPLVSLVFRYEGEIAIKNLNGNSCTINNVRLLTISMTVVMMINVFGSSLITSISDFFADSKYQIEVQGDDIDQNYIKKINALQGISQTYPMYISNNVKVKNYNSTIPTLNGIDAENYLDFFELHYDGNCQDILNKLSEGNNILVSSTLKASMAIKEGDKLSIVMQNDDVEFTVVGFYDTLESAALVDGSCLKDNMGLEGYTNLLLKTDNNEPNEVLTVKDSVITSSMGLDLQIKTLDEIKQSSLDSNKQIITIMDTFSLITLIIAITGMINNVIISFMEKKWIFSVQRAIGMSKIQLVKVTLIESALTGLIGSLLGAVGGLCLLFITPMIMKNLGLQLVMHISVINVLEYLGCGILISILSSLSSIIKSSKMSIIETIKYE